jgi:hypothetical protein
MLFSLFLIFPVAQFNGPNKITSHPIVIVLRAISVNLHAKWWQWQWQRCWQHGIKVNKDNDNNMTNNTTNNTTTNKTANT